MANILLVDDDAQVRAFARDVLADGGHTVREARDGNEGLKEFHREPADLVVCDLFMPEREGIETIIELRRSSPSVRVLAITGGNRYGGPGRLLTTAKTLGANGVLAKPFTADQFLVAVAAALATG